MPLNAAFCQQNYSVIKKKSHYSFNCSDLHKKKPKETFLSVLFFYLYIIRPVRFPKQRNKLPRRFRCRAAKNRLFHRAAGGKP